MGHRNFLRISILAWFIFAISCANPNHKPKTTSASPPMMKDKNGNFVKVEIVDKRCRLVDDWSIAVWGMSGDGMDSNPKISSEDWKRLEVVYCMKGCYAFCEYAGDLNPIPKNDYAVLKLCSTGNLPACERFSATFVEGDRGDSDKGKTCLRFGGVHCHLTSIHDAMSAVISKILCRAGNEKACELRRNYPR